MGAQNSKPKNNNEDTPDTDKETENMKIENVIDYTAAKYITTSSFTDMINLHKPEYCDKLVILTSKVIEKYVNNMDIKFLEQRTEKGVPINRTADANIIYLAKNQLDTVDVQNKFKKQHMCNAIAKFYVKIAHLFACISMTINPRYTYTDPNGREITVPLSKKKDIPKHLQIKYSKFNLCSRRISALMTRQNTENGIVIKVNNCDMNKKINTSIDGIEVPISSTEDKMLSDEPGIPELELLYYDDFDLDKGVYKGMTEETRKNVYEKDVEKFYISFTGEPFLPNEVSIIVNGLSNSTEEEIGNYFQSKFGFVEKVEKKPNGEYIVRFGDKTEDIKKKKEKGTKSQKKTLDITQIEGTPVTIKKYEVLKFSDIPLKDFHNQELCKDPESPWNKSYKSTQSDKLFNEYAQHLKKMISASQKIEHDLLSVIKEIFSFWIDPIKKQKKLTINPKLTKDKLKELVDKTRENVIKLYVGCEDDFQKGLSIFEAVITQKMMLTTERRINKFQNKADSLKGVVEDESTEKKAPNVEAVDAEDSSDLSKINTSNDNTSTPIEDMSDFNKPKIIKPTDNNINKQPDGTEQLKDKLSQINQNVTNINIQAPYSTAVAMGGSRKRKQKKKKRNSRKKR